MIAAVANIAGSDGPASVVGDMTTPEAALLDQKSEEHCRAFASAVRFTDLVFRGPILRFSIDELGEFDFARYGGEMDHWVDGYRDQFGLTQKFLDAFGPHRHPSSVWNNPVFKSHSAFCLELNEKRR